MTEERDEIRLTAEERRLVATLREELDPGPRTPAQRSAFSRSLEERLQRGGRAPPWRPFLLAASAALAAVALFLAMPGDGPEVEESAPSLLAYAYYETDYLEDTSDEWLTAEYEAIANAFDVP